MKLLVSVRDADEAREAFAGGADIIDVKEPNHGSLGAATTPQLLAVRGAIDCVPLSAALGELLDEASPEQLGAVSQYDFAKVGLAGCARLDDWPHRWQALISRLPPAI